MKKHARVWLQLTNCAFMSYTTNRLDTFSYFIGKTVRFGFFALMIFSIFRFTDNISGYGKYEALLFFLTFNLIDSLSQALFRGVYVFKPDVQRGQLDYLLPKPVNTLFYILSRLTDMLDIIFSLLLIVLTMLVIQRLPITWGGVEMGWYTVLIILGLLIIIGIHILTVAITIRTEESDSIIWLYRRGLYLGSFPPEIFNSTGQFLFTYILPIFVIVAFPVKALLGLLDWQNILAALGLTILWLGGAILFWKSSLKKYSSASS
ncbi:MAG TPA: ABC-2 family transporter protein [Patescibacteria group bacterium]|nr:ABC-2 family transporter protein [Patescibacteria group bacterium]